MRIAFYGGGFNPPHLGHAEVLRSVLRELKPDRLLVLPDRQSPHKGLPEASPDPAGRMELCRLAFGEIEGIELSDLNFSHDGPSYTAVTVDLLRQRFAEDELILVIGTDMFLSFEEWYRFEYLLEQCTLAVLSRNEDDGEELRAHRDRLEREYGARVRLLSHAPLPMSSTQIRELLPRRLGAELLEEKVYGHIIRKHYYNALPELNWLREKAYAMLSEKRIAHVAGCETEAVRLAERWGEDPEKAATAGILHDITKKLKYDQQLQLLEKYGMICDSAELANPKLLHAITGAALARDLFGIDDEIYGAIRWHTTGKPDMTLLEKIIYLADYIEPTRDFPGLKKLRKCCYQDLDAAMALGLRMSLEEIRSQGTQPHTDSVEAYRWYSREKDQ